MSIWFRRVLVAITLTLMALPVPALAQGERPPSRRFRVTGTVAQVSIVESTLTLGTRRGFRWEIHVSGDTVYRSAGEAVEGLADIEIGAKVLVGGSVQDGQAHAALVAVRQVEASGRDGRASGKIEEVALGQESFLLVTPNGESLRIQVTADTRFTSRSGEIDELGDLEVGMAAHVLYQQNEGSLVALRVAVGELPHRPRRRPIRANGEISSVSRRHISLELSEGESITLAITESTRIRVRGGGQLAPGMDARVFGYQLQGERPVAVVILAEETGGAEFSSREIEGATAGPAADSLPIH